MDMVTIRAVVAAHGLRKGAEVTVAETPLVAGAISNGVFKVLDRIPPSQPETSQDGTTNPGWSDETFAVLSGETVPDAGTHDGTEGDWFACPACMTERADYEGPGKHLDTCPHCGSDLAPVPNQVAGFSGAEAFGGDELIEPAPPVGEVFCKCMNLNRNCRNRHYQDWLDEQTPEVAADNSTIVPAPQPGTRKRRG